MGGSVASGVPVPSGVPGASGASSASEGSTTSRGEGVGEGATEKLNVPRSTIPAITHVDYSARLQTVRHDTNPLYWDILASFKSLTGCPVVVNTSFNVRGEPIVCTPEDAYRCFMRTAMDVLVLENHVLVREDQPKLEEKGDWKKEFTLD